MKKNIRMTLEYDGSRYDGWQKQGNTDNTIQGKLEAVLFKWTGQEVEVYGSGRTDAGVHARGQTANFHIEEKFCPSAAAAMEYMNRYLPEDIRVIDAKEVPERFHSRLSAVRKTYAYYVETADRKCVFERKYVYGLGRELDIPAMEKAAGYLLGEHDFKSFCCVRTQAESTVRHIYSLEVVREASNYITIRVTGNGFLYNMVRIIAGTLVEIGEGRRCLADVKQALSTGERKKAGPTAPPEGLVLVEIREVP